MYARFDQGMQVLADQLHVRAEIRLPRNRKVDRLLRPSGYRRHRDMMTALQYCADIGTLMIFKEGSQTFGLVDHHARIGGDIIEYRALMLARKSIGNKC